MRRVILLLVACSFAVLAWTQATPGPLIFHVTRLVNDRHVFYTALLEQALKAAGYSVQIDLVPPMAQTRQWQEVKTGNLTLVWGVQTTERDKEWLGVDNGLTNGLIGLRILMVAKADKEIFAGVKSLEDFRALNKTGGAGEGWLEDELWPLNGLKLQVLTGDWNRLFTMVASRTRGIDYMIRGAQEAVVDITHNPDLAIEPHVVLTHNRDMHFYVGAPNAWLVPILADALAKADSSGLKKRLIAQYLEPELGSLKLETRTRLILKTPAP